MASELHSRLEYLVNYSSQLIFVSGDSIAEQQRTLESFVFQQSDNTELAFITAEPDLEVTEYRGTLCKQLLGQVVGTYIRPLNELLAGLNHHDGPVLITITQAQYLPDSFLQELWDLVLQSRFANNKQHLNVLLFGESDWAEQAKEWLPAKNTSTPLLISSQSVSTEHYSSEVDRLLAERRAAFERYRQERGQAGAIDVSPNRFRSPWVWIGIGLVFISSFVALMGWQYGTTITTLFNPIGEQLPAQEQALVTPSPITKPTRTLSIVKQENPQNPQPEQQKQAATTPQPRVLSSFDDALKALPPVSPPLTDSEPEPANESTATTKTGNVPLDSDQSVKIKAESAEIIPEPAAAIAENESVANVPSDAQFALANDSLINSPTGLYWLQLAGMQDLQLAKDFLADHNLSSKVALYKTYRYGGDWYVILWAEPATSLTGAQQQLAQLPVFPGSNKAFIKSGRQVKSELDNQP